MKKLSIFLWFDPHWKFVLYIFKAVKFDRLSMLNTTKSKSYLIADEEEEK